MEEDERAREDGRAALEGSAGGWRQAMACWLAGERIAAAIVQSASKRPVRLHLSRQPLPLEGATCPGALCPLPVSLPVSSPVYTMRLGAWRRGPILEEDGGLADAEEQRAQPKPKPKPKPGRCCAA